MCGIHFCPGGTLIVCMIRNVFSKSGMHDLAFLAHTAGFKPYDLHYVAHTCLQCGICVFSAVARVPNIFIAASIGPKWFGS